VCRKFEGAAYPSCQVPDLPNVGILEDPPFTYMGLDFARPWMFKVKKNCQHRKPMFAYFFFF